MKRKRFTWIIFDKKLHLLNLSKFNLGFVWLKKFWFPNRIQVERYIVESNLTYYQIVESQIWHYNSIWKNAITFTIESVKKHYLFDFQAPPAPPPTGPLAHSDRWLILCEWLSGLHFSRRKIFFLKKWMKKAFDKFAHLLKNYSMQ